MDTNSTNITFQRVREDANTIKECSNTMRNIFDEFGTSMNRVGAKDVFYGDASQTLGDRFKGLQTKFDEYVELINDFANIILSASEKTERTDKSLEQQAQSLQI